MIAINRGPSNEVVRCLSERIYWLIGIYPEIAEQQTPGCLFEYSEFEYRDLNPTMTETVLAFNAAITKWKLLVKH